ncbi:MAG TPA: hypothetical protein VF398_07035, partial [bacterium]
EYHDLIKNASGDHVEIPRSSEIKKLNYLRIGIKHIGNFPDPKANSYMPIAVREMIEFLSSKFLQRDLDSISLKDCIKNETMRALVDNIEEKTRAGDFKGALEVSAMTVYFMLYLMEARLVEIHGALGRYYPIFLRREDYHPDRVAIDLLAKGIDPTRYRYFKALTPMVVYASGIDDRAELKWNKKYGHEHNWNEKNAKFCHGFVIDVALKFEETAYDISGLVRYEDVYYDRIESVVDVAKFYEFRPVESSASEKAMDDLFESVLGQKPTPSIPAVILVLKKGESLLGWIEDDSGDSDFIRFQRKDYETQENKSLFVYVRKTDVSVSRIEIKTSQH